MWHWRIWYDSYLLVGRHIYNPKSVTDTLRDGGKFKATGPEPRPMRL